ncbi:MAG: DUF3256 family protein [Paludibacteraceae bacterium]
MKLFPIENKIDTASYAVGVISTVCAPVCSSYILFYNADWSKIDKSYTLPTAADWLLDKTQIKQGVKLTDIFKTTFI